MVFLNSTFYRTSQNVAFASVFSFGLQIVFALVMVQLFTPLAVGEFSVISQIAFFWMTLALAQTPLSLLANQTDLPHALARTHWYQSLARYCVLAPLVWMALWMSQLHVLPAFVWVALIAVSQLSWGLAQSLALRTGRWQIAVRVVPPSCSMLVAIAGALMNWHGPTLLAAALCGYAAGSAWLVPAWLKPFTPTISTGNVAPEHAATMSTLSSSRDERSALLRMAHTLVDVVLATALIIVWQRLYGAQDTGWLGALLRVLGFVPALVHMAWAQVKLSQGHDNARHALLVGGLGFGSVLLLALGIWIALQLQWLDASWQGMRPYIGSLVIWQGCACISAALSHRPFQSGQATTYSWACMSIACVQLIVLFTPMAIGQPLDPVWHIYSFACVSAISLLALGFWMKRLPSHLTPSL